MAGVKANRRKCSRCQAWLAADNRGDLCRPCQRAARNAMTGPPDVPDEFWEDEALRNSLLRDRHIGRAIRHYRNHPYHRMKISQGVAAAWLGISQTQLARIENDRRPVEDLGRLIQWAKRLQIPPELLWFTLPGETSRQTANSAGQAAGDVVDTEENHDEMVTFKALIRQRHLSYDAFCREWNKVAESTDPALVRHYPGRAQYYRWLRGELSGKHPYPDACRMLEAMFPEYSVEELFSPYAEITSAGEGNSVLAVRPTGNAAVRESAVSHSITTEIIVPDSRRLEVDESVMGAAELVLTAGAGYLNPISIEQAFDETRQLLVSYLSSSGANSQVLSRATELRSSLQKMTGSYRSVSQSSDIYLIIGLLSGICSYITLDLGHPDKAMTQARAAFMMGDLAGHDGLRAWALGTRSLIARFQDRYPEALDYIRQGYQYATTGTSLVRLRCGEGQTLARMGDAENAIHALELAKDARESVNSPDIANGIFTFTEAKQSYYSGSSLQCIPSSKTAQSAESESMQAIRLFQASNPENRAVSDELLAHVYLGNIRLTLGEIDGSAEALRPVLDLPEPERSAWHRKRLRQIARRLEKGNFAASRTSVSIREEIAEFIGIPKQ